MNEKTLELLVASDDPVQDEVPSDFDWHQAMEEVRVLKPRLENILGQSLRLDDNVQDATFFASLAHYQLRADANAFEATFAMCFSSFGRLVTVYSTCEPPQKIDPVILSRTVSL